MKGLASGLSFVSMYSLVACVKSQKKSQLGRCLSELRTNVHGQAHELAVCKNTYNGRAKRPLAFLEKLIFVRNTLTNTRKQLVLAYSVVACFPMSMWEFMSM